MSAQERYDELMAGEDEINAVERLRFFCSLAMNGQDWLDVEPYFDAITAELEALRTERDEARRTMREAHEAGTTLAAELEALRADAAMHKRAVDVIFEDESGDLDYIRWYIATHVLQARKGAA